MTREARNIKLKHLITCMKCEVSGKSCDENCSTQYEAGNIGEIIENLEAISEILEQQPCEDCISREAVNDGFKKYENGSFAYGCVRGYINELPSVTPKEKTRWIPVSERLPEKHQDVLLSLRSLDIEIGFRAETEPYFYCQGTYIEPQNVLAWMPLPERYKDGE